MKKFNALVLLALFIVSLVPAAFAQDVDVAVDASVDVNADVRSTTDADRPTKKQRFASKVRANTHTNAQARIATKAHNCADAEDPEACRKRLAQGVRKVHAGKEACEASDDPQGCKATLRRGVKTTARVRHNLAECNEAENPEECKKEFKDRVMQNRKDAIRKAIDHCKQSDNQEKCREMAQRRLANLETLDEAGIARAGRMHDRLVDRHEKWKEARENNPNLAKFKGKAMNARTLARDRVSKARDRYQNAREKYQDHREKYQEARKRFQANKERLKECKDNDSEECDNVRDEARSNAVAQLQRAIESVISKLESLLGRIEGAESLSEEEAAEMTANVQAKLDLAIDLKAKADALGDDATKEEITALSKEVRELLKDIDKGIKKQAGRAVNARIGQVVAKSAKLVERLDHALLKAAENGKDTSSVEPLVDEFNSLVADAQSAYESAQEKFKADDVSGAHADIRAAHSSLKEAHAKLKEVVRAMHSMGAEDELSTSLEATASVDAEIEASSQEAEA